MSKKLHILFLCSWYPNKYDETNGNFIQKHAEAVSLYNHVTAMSIFADSSINKQKIEYSTINRVLTLRVYYPKPNFKISLFNPVVKIFRFLNAFFSGYRFLTKNHSKPCLVHVNVAFHLGLMAVVLKYIYKIPFVVTEHWTAFLPNGFKISKFTQYLCKFIFNQSELILPVSQNLADCIAKLGVKKPFSVISNVADEKIFTLKNLNNTNRKQIIHISTAKDEHKNISGILRTIAKLSQQRNDFILLIISDGNLNPHINLAEKLNLLPDWVQFKTTQTTNQIAEAIKQSDFLLLFSNYENFPCVISEALMCGIPVVSSNVNGIPEHVNASNGILVNPKAENELFNAINTMLNTCREYDAAKLRDYAFLNFSYSEVGKQYTNIYHRVLPKNA